MFIDNELHIRETIYINFEIFSTYDFWLRISVWDLKQSILELLSRIVLVIVGSEVHMPEPGTNRFCDANSLVWVRAVVTLLFFLIVFQL